MTESHAQEKTVSETAYYDQHEDRKASREYNLNHNWLVHIEEHPCDVCGKTYDEARDDGEYLETHHMVPWATFNSVDKDKFADLFDPNAEGTTLSPHGYAEELANAGKVDSPDHICNLRVLCSSCHRYKETGIHETTGPLYLANSITPDGRGVLHKQEAK